MIEVENLSIAYEEHTVLENYNFHIEKGTIVAIMGANGVGKTTLLRALINDLKIQKGKISVHGKIGFVPQLFNLPFEYSVLDVILMGRARFLNLYQSPGSKDYDIAYEYMEMMRVKELANQNFNELSGGQRQLVIISQALVSECDILILDEPTSALDYKNQALVLRKMKDLNNKLNLTILYTTHLPQHAAVNANYVLLMKTSNQYKFGKTSDILSQETLSELYEIPIEIAKFVSDQNSLFAPRYDYDSIDDRRRIT